METEDESASYMKLFNEGSHNYLLQSSEDGLNDSFPVESIFTQITSDWSTEGFPILLSGSLVAEENNDTESNENNIVLREQNESSNANEDSNGENALTFFSSVDKNGIVLANDVLLRIEDNESQSDNTVAHVINGNTYSISYEPEPEGSKDDEPPAVEFIQLLNADGTITTINKDVLGLIENQHNNSFDSLYMQVNAYKCKVCRHLAENVEDIQNHIMMKHVQKNHYSNVLNATNSSTQLKEEGTSGTKMESILSCNKENKKYIVFFCSECGNGYSSKESLKTHMVTQHSLVCIKSEKNDQNAVEAVEPKTADRRPGSKNNAQTVSISLLKMQKTAKKIKCSIKGCPFKFAKDEYRKRHEDCHVNQEKRQFMCPECKEKFSIWRICNMHLWKCHKIDLGLLSCPMCNQYKANSSVKIVSHMRIHNEEKPFLCNLCGKRYKQINQLRNHEITHKSPEETPSWSSVKTCEYCDRTFANSKCLKKHIKFVHDKFKPFICNICGHQTSRKEMLQIHYRQHTGDKPYHCLYCDYKSADRNCLRKHTMKHFGETKYSCPHCDFQSIQTTTIKNHIVNKHPGKEGTYSCNICTYTTINAQHYAAHVKCHEFEKKKEAKAKLEKASQDANESAKHEATIQNKEVSNIAEDDETQNFLNTEQSEDVVDTGGITIPAEFDLQLTK